MLGRAEMRSCLDALTRHREACATRERAAVEIVRSMSAESQLDLVEAYLGRVLHGRAPGSLRDPYMAVLRSPAGRTRCSGAPEGASTP